MGLRTRNSYDIWPVLCLNIEVDGRLCLMYSSFLMKSCLKTVWRALKKRGGFERYCIGVLGGLGRNLVWWSVANSYDIWRVLCLNVAVKGGLCCMYSLVLMKCWLKSVWRALKSRGGGPGGTVYVYRQQGAISRTSQGAL